MVGEEKKRAIAGFILSLIAGIIILIVAIFVYAGLGSLGLEVVFDIIFGAGSFDVLFALGFLWGILVIVGAALLLIGKTTVGGILVILFSILSLFSLAVGGLIIGLILGIIGGALGIAKK